MTRTSEKAMARMLDQVDILGPLHEGLERATQGLREAVVAYQDRIVELEAKVARLEAAMTHAEELLRGPGYNNTELAWGVIYAALRGEEVEG